MPGGSGNLNGGDHGELFGKQPSTNPNQWFIDLERDNPEAAKAIVEMGQAHLDFITRQIDRLEKRLPSTPGELADGLADAFDGVTDERAEQIAARIDEIRNDPDFQRYKDTDIGDLPDDGTRAPESFDGSGYKPMAEWRRKFGEVWNGVGQLIGGPATGLGDISHDAVQAAAPESAITRTIQEISGNSSDWDGQIARPGPNDVTVPDYGSGTAARPGRRPEDEIVIDPDKFDTFTIGNGR